MSFTFPASPTTGQIFTPSGGPTYVWNGYGWSLQTAPVALSGLVLLNTLTANNTQYLTDTTSFTSAYDSYEFELLNLTPAVNGSLAMQIQIAGAWTTSGCYTMAEGAYGSGFATTALMGADVLTNNPYYLLSGTSTNTGAPQTAAGYGVSGIARLHSISGLGGTAYKALTGHVVYVNPSASPIVMTLGGYCVVAGVMSGARIFFPGTNVNVGAVRIYGRKTS
jgi:hypothetical protein